MIAPADAVKRPASLPGAGEIRVTIVAELPDGDTFGLGFLAELPTTPVNGSQRVRIKADSIIRHNGAF